MTADTYIVYFWVNENILELVVMVAHPEYMKICTLVCFNLVNFIICELYLNFLKMYTYQLKYRHEREGQGSEGAFVRETDLS